MNRHAMLWLLLLLSLGAAAAAQGEGYYYYKGEQVPLAFDTSQILVRIQGYSLEEGSTLLQNALPGLTFDPIYQPGVESFGLFDIPDGADYAETIDSIAGLPFVSCINPVIIGNDSAKTYIVGTILCKFLPTVLEATKDSLIDFYGLNTIEDNVDGSEFALLELINQSDFTVLEIANRLYENGYAEFSHPNFYAPYRLESYAIQDQYYNESQINMQRVVGVPGYDNAAWEISTGDSGIMIAIIDQGIAPHEDYDTSAFFPWGVDAPGGWPAQFPQPTSDDENHGMSVAGLICGRHNNPVEGPGGETGYASMAGVAPGCKILAERLFAGESSSNIYHASDMAVGGMYYYANICGVGVVNCSWKGMGTSSDYVDQAIEYLVANGRDGLGAVVIFAAGNHRLLEYPRIVWPATLDNVLAVGAIANNDELYNYSNFGPELDLVAPSASGNNIDGIWTTDQMDMAGENPTYFDSCMPENDIDYRCTFGGTSAAAPLVTGTAALIMSVRPDLTATEVIEVLKNSAVKDLDWGTITPEDQIKYGAGRVNAFRALLAVWRGDVNNDKSRNLGDAVHIINYIFRGGPPPAVHKATADTNNDGNVNVGDAIYLINFIFRDGPAPLISYTYDYNS